MKDRESEQVKVADTPVPKGVVLGTDSAAMAVRCSSGTRSIAGTSGALDTSYVTERGKSDTTLPRKRTRQCQRVGRMAQAAS